MIAVFVDIFCFPGRDAVFTDFEFGEVVNLTICCVVFGFDVVEPICKSTLKSVVLAGGEEGYQDYGDYIYWLLS